MNLKTIFSIVITSTICSINAQQIDFLDIGNVKALIHSDGNLFQDIANGNPSFEVPKNSNKYSIYASSFWFSSKSVRNGIPHTSAAYERFGNDDKFKIGPVDIVNQVGLTSTQFQRLWKVEKSDILSHIQNWNTPGYLTPQSILDWPGNGTSNTAQNLAPYADLDGDQIYEPLSGEYPIIKGDQAVYLILNDYREEDTLRHLGNVVETYGPLKIEIHVMLYAFANNIPAISNSVFVETSIYNRSNSAIDDHNDFHASIYADFDLGNPSDDYVGTNISKNLFYAYNGDFFDEATSGHAGYGSNLAAQGILFLDNNIEHAIYYNSSSGQNGDPSIPSHFANYQRGKWKNGSQIKYGGDGYSSACTTNTFSKLMFDGNPNLSSQSAVWTEKFPCIGSAGISNAPGDRRMLGGPSISKNLAHGQSLQFNYAYVFAQDDQTSQSLGSPVAKLFQETDIVQAFYDNTITNIKHVEAVSNEFKIFPNPAGSQIQVKTESKNFEIELLDMKGSVLLKTKNTASLDLSPFENGVYFVRMIDQHGIQTKKLIITK